jgi:uncharacterized repeat protein (TIGR01451 family)
MKHALARLAAPALLLGLALQAGGARAAPDPAWTAQASRSDCFGAGAQGTPACESYASDLYEHINYGVPNPGTADIQEVSTGSDADYLYIEWDFALAYDPSYSTGHAIVVEFDVDPALEADRGDYYVSLFQKVEFDTTTWVDAYSSGGYESYRDANDDVGGANPTASDFGGSGGNGYNTNIPGTSDRVWARVVGGNFQVAVRRSLLGSPASARLRPWSRQSTSLPKDKLYFHDQNASTDVQQIDNLSGLGTDTWIEVGDLPDLVVLKLAQTLEDPVNGTMNPKAIPGATKLYTVQVTNVGAGAADADSVIVSDAIPPEAALRVVDFDVSNPGPVAFVDGSPSSGLSYTFIGLASAADDIDFSDDGGVTWTYAPADSGDGTDPAVTHIRVNPKGTLQPSGSGDPSFQLLFKVPIR